ncbi:hypothetical protein Poli38472_010521 [Pythium oligandrum]|uniref:Peptidase S1 domain-containing protein n=1 Tax=Pythium oligandrum TaxID=41045 RepID=A0A8K1C3B3_PYTOL|nr:hypothetical protein Poli38472_010521 [Pythium oligandrum]|eukprot:TMW55639.1 hypothetical protein Poli38472_010521 [Pythium oligandrum]
MKFAAIATAGALAVATASASDALSYTQYLASTELQAKLLHDANVTDSGSKIKPLIVGGSEVPVGQKLWTAGLRETATGSDFCGGTLITPKHVLTAAHCYGTIKYVAVGTHYLSGSTDGERIKVSKQTKHPQNNANTMTYDFLLLELATESKQTPIKLKIAEPAVGVTATVNGWGVTTEDGSQPSGMRQVDVPIVSDSACAKVLDIVPATNICAGGKKGKDSCQGDSGGPLTVKSGSDDVLVGVVSWGNGCGLAGYPDIDGCVSLFCFLCIVDLLHCAPYCCAYAICEGQIAEKSLGHSQIFRLQARSSSRSFIMKFAAIVSAGALAVATASAKESLSFPEYLVKSQIATFLANHPEPTEGNKFQPLIVGGTEVPVGQKLWTAGLRETAAGESFCGGSLITPKHVLTAAHCYGTIAYVSVGTHYIGGSKDGERIKVSKQTIHPKNNADTMSNDFLILELASESKVAPIKLKTTEPAVGVTATVNGWGALKENGNSPDGMRQVDVPVVSDETCAKKLDIIPENNICAGGKKNKDSCQGDSGGPLTVQVSSEDVLVGVVSWGDGCGMAGYPGVYASVPSAKAWIDATIGASGYNATWVA